MEKEKDKYEINFFTKTLRLGIYFAIWNPLKLFSL